MKAHIVCDKNQLIFWKMNVISAGSILQENPLAHLFNHTCLIQIQILSRYSYYGFNGFIYFSRNSFLKIHKIDINLRYVTMHMPFEAKHPCRISSIQMSLKYIYINVKELHLNWHFSNVKMSVMYSNSLRIMTQISFSNYMNCGITFSYQM